MGIDTNSRVEDLKNVDDGQGNPVAPASDDHAHEWDTNVSIDNNSIEQVPVEGPNRPRVLKLHVEGVDAFDTRVVFEAPDGTALTARGPSNNSDYRSSDGSDVFLVTDVASQFLTVEIEDMSGGENTVNYSVMMI